MRLPRHTAAAVLFVLALALYLPAMANGFAYDDVAIIQLNERVHSLRSIPALFTQSYWADAELALYRPVTTSTFAIDWVLSGGRPAWFQLVNALLNAAVCVLLFRLLHRFAGAVAAFAGALVFAVHPVHVEAVANVVGRAELLAALFTLGAMLLWPRVVAVGTSRIAGVCGLFALALLSKESAIMLPALLVLLDVATGDLKPDGITSWLRRRAVPLGALAAIATGYIFIRAMVLGGVAPSRLDAALEVTSGADRILTALQAWPVIVRLMLFPVVLLADYGPRILMPATSFGVAAPGVLVFAGLVIGGVIAWLRGHGVIAAILLWLPVALLPVSNLVVPIGIIIAERTLYLPVLAVAALVTVVASVIAPQHRRAGAFVLALVVVFCAARTSIRIPDWRSTDAIMLALLRDRPDAFRAHWHHARMAAAEGLHDVAIRRYVRAVELWPFRERLVIETVRAAGLAGNLRYARELAAYAVGRWPQNTDAARLYAAAALDMSDTVAARDIIQRSLRSIPNDSLLLRMQDAISKDTLR